MSKSENKFNTSTSEGDVLPSNEDVSIISNKYAILCETNGEEMEQWYTFIKHNGNETALKYLNDQLNKVDMYIVDDLSTFELDLENLISEQTAKEMIMIDINSYMDHRKFDGELQLIDFKLKKRDDNDAMLEKIHNKISFGDIDKYLDKEDLNGKEVVNEDSEDDGEEELVPHPNSKFLPN